MSLVETRSTIKTTSVSPNKCQIERPKESPEEIPRRDRTQTNSMQVNANSHSSFAEQVGPSSHPPELEPGRRASGGAQSGQSSLSSQSGGEEQQRHQTSNADYDHIRNTTLMFFLDRLFIASKEGKESRTLHDLSCLFGTRDFTKDMRQIVGASRNGLRKFLQSYPSLFTIDGDKVYLTQLKQEASGASSTRDYNREAVDYFTEKLVQFGASLVPIRNLFGYRSQASQEVRHVSGKSTKEFKQFLSANQDVFEILDDKHVVLRSALKELESRGQLAGHQLSSSRQPELNESASAGTENSASSSPSTTTSQPNHDHHEPPTMDPYLNKQFAHTIEDCMKRMRDSDEPNPMRDHNRVSLEYLHDKIMNDCNNQLFLNMVKTINDLKVFLRMHPKIFKRFKCDQDQRDYVSLLSEEERRELIIQGYPSSLILTRQNSNLKRSQTVDSQLSDTQSNTSQQHDSLPYIKQASSFTTNTTKPDDQDREKQAPPAGKSALGDGDQRLVSPPQTPADDDNNNDTHSIASTTSSHNLCSLNSNGHQSSPSSLRATAPPFVPSTRLKGASQQPKSIQAFPVYQNKQQQPQISNGGPRKLGNGVEMRPPLRSLSNLSQTSARGRQQVRQVDSSLNQVDSHQALRSYLLKVSSVNQANGLYSPNKPSNGGGQALPIRHVNVGQDNDDLRARTVNIVREASNIVARIMNTTNAVALDCKGYNLGFNGQITLIQFGFLPTNPKSQAQYNHHAETVKDGANNSPAPKQTPEVCIFDLITNPELAYCLKPLLESDQVVKIVHDVRNKSNALYSQFGIMLNHVFDTQVANLVIQQQETGKPAYKSRYISIGKLCEIYGDESLSKYRELIKSKHPGGYNSSNKIKDVNYWCARPLTDSMVYESTMDVYSLVGSVYENLKSRIKPEYMDLFEQLNKEGVLARIKPDEIRSVKKERKIDLEVIDLKRKLYSDTTSSIVLSNREIRLLRHIDLTEEVRQKIQQCKKVAKKIERLDMKAAQILQSMNSQQMESTDGEDQSLNGLSMQQSLDLDKLASQEDQTQGEDRTAASEKDSKSTSCQQLTEMEMGNLMDGSMFDELKYKMIESSSLLESLEDDDEEMAAQAESIAAHSGAHSDHDNCRCNCHRGSLDGEKINSSLKSSISSTSAGPVAVEDADSKEVVDLSVESTTSSGRAAVDMAVQCDLLS